MSFAIAPALAAPAPTLAWLELTSPYALTPGLAVPSIMSLETVRRTLGHLHRPHRIVLCSLSPVQSYPEWPAAIRVALETRARVELRLNACTLNDQLIPVLAGSGVHQISVLLGARGEPGAVDREMRQLETLVAQARQRQSLIEFSVRLATFDLNATQAGALAAFAKRNGIRQIVLERVPSRELELVQVSATPGGAALRREPPRERLLTTLEDAASRYAGVEFVPKNFGEPFNGTVSEIPKPFPGPLPEGAAIHSCVESPMESIRVLADGSLVACDVLRSSVLGNVADNSLERLWHGADYRGFRRTHTQGLHSACRNCEGKTAYRPRLMRSEIAGTRGWSAQLGFGWHTPNGDPVLWSAPDASLVLQPRRGAAALHVAGMLPPGRPGEPNELTIRCNGAEVGHVSNPGEEMLSFDVDFAIHDGKADAGEPWLVTFHVRHIFRPRETGLSDDSRGLGFALILASSQRPVRPAMETIHLRRLRPLRSAIEQCDRWSRRVVRLRGHRVARIKTPPVRPGVSVVITERENPEELHACLRALEVNLQSIGESSQVLIHVNGAPATRYSDLRREFSWPEWRFSMSALGSSAAIAQALRETHHDWVYLLDDDAALQSGALLSAMQLRRPNTFAVATQTFLRDPSRFRDQTNFKSLKIENGLAAVQDLVAADELPRESLFAGRCAGLFRKDLLTRFVRETTVYAPFDWDDAEWGWRARKLGYHNVFCPASQALHLKRGTIGLFYPDDEIEAIHERNRLLFQLRNLTAAGHLDAVYAELAAAPGEVFEFFDRGPVRWGIVLARRWNHFAPVSDESILESTPMPELAVPHH